jgi:MFS family permease
MHFLSNAAILICTNESRHLNRSSHFSGAGSSLSRSSSSSSSSSSDDSGSSYSYIPPDGGYGWVIVIASFIVNMIADGVTFSFGVLFVELQAEFHESKAYTAGVVSLFHAVPLLSGPIASALTDRYGCRKMTILGSLLATTGFILSSFCYSLELLYVTFGLISGFGLSLCYVSAYVIVAYYFDRRRSFATGISVCGSGVGTFIFAPLTRYLVVEYGGWRGATLILGGLFLNMTVCILYFVNLLSMHTKSNLSFQICGALFRDIKWASKKKRKMSSKKSKLSEWSTSAAKKRTKGSMGSFSAQSQSPGVMPDIKDLKELLENGDISSLFVTQDGEGPSSTSPRTSR